MVYRCFVISFNVICELITSNSPIMPNLGSGAMKPINYTWHCVLMHAVKMTSLMTSSFSTSYVPTGREKTWSFSWISTHAFACCWRNFVSKNYSTTRETFFSGTCIAMEYMVSLQVLLKRGFSLWLYCSEPQFLHLNSEIVICGDHLPK